jgi:hypothetical protein
MDGVAGVASAAGKRARDRDLIVDKLSSQRRKSGQVARIQRPVRSVRVPTEERKVHVVSGGGYERVQPGGRVLSGGSRLGNPAAAVRPTVRAGLVSGMPLLGEQVSDSAVVAWHLHLPSVGVKRSGFGRGLIAYGACEFTGGRLVWSSTSGAGSLWAERPVRCGFC